MSSDEENKLKKNSTKRRGSILSENFKKKLRSSEKSDTSDEIQSPDIPTAVNLTDLMDPVVLRTIALLEFKRRFSQELDRKVANVKRLKSMKLPEERSETKSSRDFTISTDGEAQIIGRKAVAVMAAHCGFSDIEAEPLECLVDAALLQLSKFCEILHHCTTRHEKCADVAFDNPIDQAFNLAGLSDYQKSIKSFYELRIRKYYENLSSECSHLYSKHGAKR